MSGMSRAAAPGVLGWPTLPLKTPEGSLLPCQEQSPLRMVSPVWGAVSRTIHLELASLLQPLLCGPDFPEPLLSGRSGV